MFLTALNDDCLEYIFKKVPLKTQIAVKETCSRFQQIILSIWQSPSQSRRVALTKAELLDFCENLEGGNWLAYMDSICNIVEDLKFACIYVEQFRLIRNLKFPKVRTLNCLLQSGHYKDNDEVTQFIAKLFPALSSLTLRASISGSYLWQLEHLVDLDLSGCEYLKTKHLQRIFKSLKLRRFAILYHGFNTILEGCISAITTCLTLEELKIDDQHLLRIIDALLRMPAIRQITCYTRDYDEYLLGKIAYAVGNRMDTMVYNDVVWSKVDHINHLVRMPNLRCLILYDDDVEDEQLCMLAANLHNLMELQLTKVRLESSKGLLNLVENCTKLEVLDVSYMPEATMVFLERIKSIVKRQSPMRATPLKLYCYGTEIALYISENTVLPKLLEVLPQQRHKHLPFARFFQCIWQPINSS